MSVITTVNVYYCANGDGEKMGDRPILSVILITIKILTETG